MPGQDNFRSSHRQVAFFREFPQISFTSVSGGAESNEVNQVFPGGSNIPVNVEGPTTIEQVTLQKPWDSIKDSPLVTWSRQWSAGIKRPLTLVVQPVSAAGIPDGAAETYLACSRVSFKRPDVERGGADAGMLEIVVQPTSKV